jgi:hypothetical protein
MALSVFASPARDAALVVCLRQSIATRVARAERQGVISTALANRAWDRMSDAIHDLQMQYNGGRS